MLMRVHTIAALHMQEDEGHWLAMIDFLACLRPLFTYSYRGQMFLGCWYFELFYDARQLLSTG